MRPETSSNGLEEDLLQTSETVFQKRKAELQAKMEEETDTLEATVDFWRDNGVPHKTIMAEIENVKRRVGKLLDALAEVTVEKAVREIGIRQFIDTRES